MLLYNGIVLAVIGMMAIIAIINIVSFRSVKTSHRSVDGPMVSVLIPARNEERSIGSCLAALAEQEYQNREVLVLDDHSDDGTADIVREWMSADSRIRLVSGAPLAPGWTGKNYACDQLAREAQGDYLLFTDADTVHLRYSIGASVHAMEKARADLLSVLPYEVMGSFWEKVVLPLLYFSTFTVLPFPLVSRTRSQKLAMANGQFMMFRRRVYDAIGGHAAVRNAIVEDVWLSRLVKKAGYRLEVMNGDRIVSCRMYTSFRGVFEGFSKNLFPGFRYSLPVMTAVVLFTMATSLGPFIFTATGLLLHTTPAWLPLAIGQSSLILFIRILFSMRFRLGVISNLLHPLAIGVFVAIAVNSCLRILRGKGAEWKGRLYDFRPHAAIQK